MKKALLALVIATAAFAAWNLRDNDTQATDTDKLLVDRIWIDHMPKNDRDVFNIFVAITEEPFGIFQATSQWKGQFELFRYELQGDELRILYGQDGSRDKVKTKATKCGERDWDYCLELSGASRGVKKYYSMKGWEIDATNLDEIKAKLKTLVAEVPAVDPATEDPTVIVTEETVEQPTSE